MLVNVNYSVPDDTNFFFHQKLKHILNYRFNILVSLDSGDVKLKD